MVSNVRSHIMTMFFSKPWCSLEIFHDGRLMCFAMYEVVSHPVNARNASNDAAEPFVTLLKTGTYRRFFDVPDFIQSC